MKNLMKFFIAALVMTSFLFQACSEDDTPGGGTNDMPPAVFISDVSDFVVDPSTEITFEIEGEAGTNEMNSFSIARDGDLLDAADGTYTIEEYTSAGIVLNNPQVLVDADRNNFIYTAVIETPADTGDYIYAVTITDSQGLTSTDDVTITVESTTVVPTGTPIDASISGVLLNQAGPSGTGGLDLDAGAGTGSSASEAEIRDVGIDCTIGGGAENWRAIFGTVNGAEMRRVDVSALENFTFGAVEFIEEIQEAYDTGFTLSDGVSQAANCDETPVTDITTPQVGDMYVVSANGRNYLIRVDEINFVSGSNNDNYVFSIKY